MRSFRSRLRLGAAAIGAAAAAGTAGAQQPISSGAFITRLGRDTISVEQFTRTADRLEGDVVRRIPNTSVVHYVFGLAPDGSLTQARITIRKADGTVVQSLSPQLGLDTYVALPEAYAPYEAWLARLRAAHRSPADVVLLSPLGGAGTSRMPVRLLDGDSARAWYYGLPIRMRVDASGRLLGLDGRGTTVKYLVTRVPTVDINRIATRFAERDAAGQALGPSVSRRDTVRAQIGHARVWIDYGRPLARGRDIFNRGILGDTLWRTGANAATQFHTDRDLMIDGKRLPAGTYSLWTRVSPESSRYWLIFNSQSGQWGTEHHPERDVLTVPLKTDRVPVTEEFTIGIDPTSPETMLTLRWGTLRMSVRVSGVNEG